MPATIKTGPKSRTNPRRPRSVSDKTAFARENSGTLAGARRVWALAALLIVTTLLIYSPVGKHPFINYDDPYYVVQNTHVQKGISWETITWAITATEESNWHPLTWLSHALDCELFGLDAGGHHWTSAVIHSLNAALLFLLLWRATGATGPSFLVAALFALHPLNVESVAWIAERKNVLSTLFFLLALGAYGWFAKRPGVGRYVVVTSLFLLGLASKPMVITLPFVLLLLDVWPLGRVKRWTRPSSVFPVPQRQLSQLVLEKLPLLIFSAGSAVVTVVAQGASVVPTTALPFWVRIEDALDGYGVYLAKAIWPVHLALIYPHPGRMLPVWQPALAVAVLLGMSFIAWKQFFARPYLAVGWLWFLGTAFPIIGIVQVGLQATADRYAYVPLIGIFLILVWAGVEAADQFRLSLLPRMAVAFIVLVALSFVTWRQIGYWESTTDLWKHALQVTRDNSFAEYYLANQLFRMGSHAEGMVHLRNFARLEPLDPIAHAQVAAEFLDHGEVQQAVKEFEAALRADQTVKKYNVSGLQPRTLAITYMNLAVAYGELGDKGNAVANARRAREIDAPAIDEMIAQLNQSLAGKPSARGYLQLGIMLEQAGRLPEADRAYAQAQQMDPQLASSVFGQEGNQ